MEESAADTATLVLRDGVIMLGAALAFVMAFRRLGLGAVLGYLVAGALIGPDGLGLINAPDEMLQVAEIGIVLLLFLVGLELHPERLWRLKADIFGLGLLQVTLSGLALTALVHLAGGFSLAASMAIGLPLALSSTAPVLPSLRADGSINTPAGEDQPGDRGKGEQGELPSRRRRGIDRRPRQGGDDRDQRNDREVLEQQDREGALSRRAVDRAVGTQARQHLGGR